MPEIADALNNVASNLMWIFWVLVFMVITR